MTRRQAELLTQSLKKRFGGKAEFEPVEGVHGRYRFAVTSKKFDKMPLMKRQDAVWEVADEVLDRETVLDVSIILAYSPADLASAK